MDYRKNTRLADEIIELLIKEDCTISEEEDILSGVMAAILRTSKVQRVNFQKEFQNILEREKQERETEVIEISTASATCVLRHMQAYLDQSSTHKKADFGAPCADCTYAKKTCDFDWYAKMKPILDRADIKLQLNSFQKSN